MTSGQRIQLWLTKAGSSELTDLGLPPHFPALLFAEEGAGLWLFPGGRDSQTPLVWIRRDYLAAIEAPLPAAQKAREFGFRR